MRERIDAPAHYGELAEWFGPLSEREAALRGDSTLNVDAHVRELVERAEELPELPPGIALVSELRKSCFRCGDCASSACGESTRRNAQNLIHAKRSCMEYVVAHFADLREVVADLVGRHSEGIAVQPPIVRLEFDVRTAGIGEPVVASHRRQGGEHVVTLAIDVTRFTRRAFHAVTAELFRVLLCNVWDGAAAPATRPSAPSDPFIEGWMAEIATKALEKWLEDHLTMRARAERGREARRLLELRAPIFEYGEEEKPGVADIRTGIRIAQDFPEACVKVSLPPKLAWEFTLTWSLGLLLRRPPSRENVVRRGMTARQLDKIIGNFAADRKGWRFDTIWNKLESSFI
ncbi:MAG: hypothetical protein E6J90_07255 [Deltaproteobacteria bacterium]|nr:MAG: hypothetical protein E6J91_21540 [Deltaproteobacteria bacterium]TMQ24737.1 MAG: hypothetical protein E6J90_07255 [Deltaproteobacteria bacterium]